MAKGKGNITGAGRSGKANATSGGKGTGSRGKGGGNRNWPSRTGNRSGRGRGNNPPKSK